MKKGKNPECTRKPSRTMEVVHGYRQHGEVYNIVVVNDVGANTSIEHLFAFHP